jgi:hypothetical protein
MFQEQMAFYTVLVARVDRGKTGDRGWSGKFVGQIAEGRRQRDKRME